jgi:type VI secretion system protein ImpK
VFLMEKFHELFGEVISLKQKVRNGELTVRAARERLQSVLASQQTEAERSGGTYGVARYLRAKYAMVALADEIFLDSKSEVDEAWMGEMLEAAEFHTQCAGDKLFADIDALQSERGEDAKELARIHLAVLGLRFRGKFRKDEHGDERLEEYREKLHRIIFGAPAKALGVEEHIVDAAYGPTLLGRSRTQLPYLRPWVWALVAVFVLWIAAGHLIWRNAAGVIEPLLDDVTGQQTPVTQTGGGS